MVFKILKKRVVIKIVIDIEKKKYENIIKNFETFPKEMKEWGLEEIKNGKPLHPPYNSKICKK